MLREFIEEICRRPPPSHLSTAAKGIWIYQNHFCKRSGAEGVEPTTEESTKFKKDLSLACEKLCEWRRPLESWTVEGNQRLAKWEGLTLSLNPSQWREDENGLEISLPYYSIGEDGWVWIDPEPAEGEAAEPKARFYLTLSPQGALFLFTKIQSMTGKSDPPFRLKLTWRLDFYFVRRDSCVIYFNRKEAPSIFHHFEPLFSQIHADGGFTPEKIPLTQFLMPGVYYAEDPITGESFGRQRSDLIARSIERCGPWLNPDALYLAAQALFREEGFFPGEPWRDKKTNYPRQSPF